jgi:hypothetical protein
VVLDYKDVRFSFAHRRARRRRRLFRLGTLLLVILGGAALYLRHLDSTRLDDAVESLTQGNRGEAERLLAAARLWPLHRSTKTELQALLDLDAGRLKAARDKFNQLDGSGLGALPRATLLRWLEDRARYRELLFYCDFLLPDGDDETRLAAALAQTALYRPNESEALLDRLSPGFLREQAKTVQLLRQFNRKLRHGRFAFIFDRQGAPLAEYDVSQRASRSLVPGIDFSAFDAPMADGVRLFTLSLDGHVQRLLEPLFRSNSGTFALIDLEDNGIMAAYSRSREGGVNNAVFTQEFEPGSIIKTATLLAYLRQAPSPIFPFHCGGSMTAAGRSFYDLIPHQTLENCEQAMAVSCNLVFARMGLLAGYDRLAETLHMFGFGAAPWRDQFLEFRLGHFRRPENDYQLCHLSVGLNEITITTLQAAMMAALIARDGETSTPYLIGSEKNVLSLGCFTHPTARQQLLHDDLAFLQLKKAMLAVVESESGTAHRARLDFVQTAVKTGTAGTTTSGLDAVLIGFFPYNRPRYAFAFRLEGSGRAEINGAIFLRDFLTRFLQP